MARIICKLLITWLLLLGALLLTQLLPLPGGVRLGDGLGWAVALTSPVVVLLLLIVVRLRLRQVFCRLRVLRRAARWQRKEPPTPWPGEGWGT